MYVDDLFHSAAGRIAAFAEMQLHLYRHDISLQDYFEALQLDTLTSPRAHSSVNKREKGD
jgi:two-component sensor histidine kinase